MTVVWLSASVLMSRKTISRCCSARRASLLDAYSCRMYYATPKVCLFVDEFTHCGCIKRAWLNEDRFELRLRFGVPA